MKIAKILYETDFLKTEYLVDVISSVHKIKTSDMNNPGEFADQFWSFAHCITKRVSRINLD